MNKCVDIVVTYNRIDLLKENIKALQKQSYIHHDIMIIDNASTDGTKEMVKNINDTRIKYYNTMENLGGAGGFAYGIKKAMELGYNYAWIMDDDSIPEPDALNSLIKKSKQINNNFSFLASLVYWIDGKIFPMNFPRIKYPKDYKKNIDLISKEKLLEINTCSFVGCFVNLKCAIKTALPISEFFFFFYDIEYTDRLSNIFPAYLDFESIIIHKAPSNKGAEISIAEVERIPRFFLQSRNGMYIARRNHKILKRFVTVGKRFIRIIIEAPNYRLKRTWILISGTFAGFFFNPELKYINEEKNDNKIRN